jgi:6-phosphogluconolactonase (cycloisomerase 2 family)
MPSTRTFAAAASLLTAAAGLAHAQSAAPAVFVANNGNLEGSVSSLRVNPDGTLTLIDRVITGTRTSTSQPCAGCNSFAIDATPSGAFLATTHASGNTSEEINVYAVAPDGTLNVAETILLPQAGLDIAWVRDDLLAVCVTDLSTPNQIRLYTWDAGASTLTLADTVAAGSFLTSVDVHPSGDWIVGNDSFANTARIFAIDGNTISLAQTVALPVSGVAVGFAPDGRSLFAAGGISAGGDKFAGFAFDPDDGTATPLAGSPFTSPGDSPKGFAFTPDNAFMFVSHGRDATIHVFALDPTTGIPAFTGEAFDVGSQGSLQGMDTLDASLFALDSSTSFDNLIGAYAFDVDPVTGALVPRPGTPLPTGGITPNDIVAWGGAGCAADFNGDGAASILDVVAFITNWNVSGSGSDFNDDGAINVLDVVAFITVWNNGCP